MGCCLGGRPRACDMGGTPASPTAPQMTDVATNRCGEPMTRPRGNPGRRWRSAVAPTPVYKKDVDLYGAIVEYAAAAKVETQKGAYLLERRDGLFVAKGKEAEALYQELRRYDIPVKPRRRGGEVELALTGWQLEYLKNRGLLNELEYDKEQKRRQQTV